MNTSLLDMRILSYLEFCEVNHSCFEHGFKRAFQVIFPTLNLTEFCNTLGVPYSTAEKWLSGSSSCPVYTMQSLFYSMYSTYFNYKPF